MVESREGREWPRYRAPDPSGVPARQRRVRAKIEDLEDGFDCDGLCNFEFRMPPYSIFCGSKKRYPPADDDWGVDSEASGGRGTNFKLSSIAGGDSANG